MIPRVEEAHHVRDFRIHIRFSDGTEGDVDLGHELYGEIFEPLKEQSFFRQFSVHPLRCRALMGLFMHRVIHEAFAGASPGGPIVQEALAQTPCCPQVLLATANRSPRA